MSEEIVNRVQKSGLVTIDMDDIELPKKILELDIKCWLSEGLFLKEKEYRNNVLSHDWASIKILMFTFIVVLMQLSPHGLTC